MCDMGMPCGKPECGWKVAPEVARAISVIREYEELKHLCEKLELEELVIAYDYVQKLIESRPKVKK